MLFCLLIAVMAPGCDRPRGTEYPARPIKIIVPFGAGGGSDTFARMIQNAVEEDQGFSQPFVIVNVAGAGGTIGSRRVKNARPDGYTLLLLHDGILTAKHSGRAAYGPEAFEPIIGTSNATQVVAVSESSPFDDLGELMNHAAKNPDSLVFAANVGAPSYFAGLMLEAESDGATFRYTQSGGGAKRFAALQGGHVDVTSFSIAEYIQFRPSGIRALALLSDERNESVSEMATAREQGFDVVSQNMQFWWAPSGTPTDRIEALAEVIDTAMNSNAVTTKLSEMRMASTVLRGEALKDELRRREEKIASVAPSNVFPLPNFPRWAVAALAGCIALAIWRHRRRNTTAEAATESGEKRPSLPERDWKSLAMISGMVLSYVSVLQFQWLHFQPATIVFVLTVGTVLALPQWDSGKGAKTLLPIAVVAVLMGVAIHHVFTQVLVVDLP